ncbi:MAG TPA: hypothetical protein VF412_01080 [Bdellovibrio sp.]|uniref:hypothetical protein n=1 Tax=Bdellovibrio sp. TaxID=28201 RepID=UPI002F1B93FB
MNKLIVSLAAVVLSVSVANAKTKSSNTYVAKAAPAERSYASENSFLAGGNNENEFETMMTNGLFSSEKVCKDCDSGTTLDIGASYLHYLRDGFQVGGEGRLRLLSKEVSGTGGSETLLDLAAVGAYNFQSDLKNAIFVKAGVGLYSVLKDSRDGYENKLGLFVGAGKRFALWSNVSYTPELRLVKKGDIDMGVEIALLNFSVIW